MMEVASTKPQEEYEDDFEKDLDWLISEDGGSEDQGSEDENVEAEIDKELEKDEKKQGRKRNQKRGHKTDRLEEEEERWPSPMEPLEYDSDRDSPSKSPPVVPPPLETDDQTDEEKKYKLEKIRQANRELQQQETPDLTRQRRLHFKEALVDLVVSPLQLETGDKGDVAEGEKATKERAKVADADSEVSGKMSELKLSPRVEGKKQKELISEEDPESKDNKVLVEKDGKFDLVSMAKVESQSVLPPMASSFSDRLRTSPRLQQQAGKSHSSSSSQLPIGSSSFHLGVNHLRAPRPPAQPRLRPSSASHSQRDNQRRNSKRRVQSATGTPCQATYSLSSQQKELLQRIQERKERLAKEAEQRKREEKDGKFDLISMAEVESQSVLPPIASSFSDRLRTSPRLQQQAGKSHSSSSSQLPIGSSSFHLGVNHLRAPRPPAQPRLRPSSASHSQRDNQRRNSKRRVQSATGTPCQATYSLSSQQKELLQRIQERKERLAKEAEQRKREEEELKRQENEQAFRSWLMKKRGQLQEERRILQAQKIERMNCKRDSNDPEDAFKSWLQRKREQQQKERQLLELRKVEEDSYLLHSRQECEHAFKLWLRRKRAEKRAEQQVAREQSRRFVLEERRARRLRDLMCTVNDSEAFRFTEQLAYRF